MHSHRGIVHVVRGYNTMVVQDERDERMCFLPLCHIAERVGGEYFGVYTGSKLNFVENPETGARERARDRAHRDDGSAARVGEVLFGRHHRAARREPPAAGGVRLGHRRGHAHRRPGARRQAGARVAEAALSLARGWRWTTCAS
jgi:hypothetical protein